MRGQGPVSGGNRAAHWLTAFALAALFTAFHIQSSLHSGALSLPVTYDDVGYFNEALARLDTLYRDGGRAFLKGFWANPPHAPLQTLLTLVGFGLLGAHHSAAAWANAISVAIVLRLILGFATRYLTLSTSVILAAALLSFPLLGMLVIECRPDMLSALLTAGGALVIVADPRWRAGDRPAVVAAAALFVGALLAKPTVVPVTVAVYGMAVASVLALQSTGRQDAIRIARIALVSGGIALLAALPYYVASARHLYEYIMVNAFGAQAHIWAKNAGTANHATYYLTGPGGQAAIGRPWLLMTGALLLSSAPVWLRSWRVAASVAAVALMAYIGVTVPGMKGPFIGAVVPAFVLGIAAIAAVAILAKLPPRASLVAALVLLAFAVLTWRPVSLRLGNTSVPAVQSIQFQRIYVQTADAVASIPGLENRRLYFPVIAQYLNPDNLVFELRRRGLPAPAPAPILYLDANIESHLRELARADVVVVFSDDNTLPLPWPASVTIRKEINAAIAETGAFETVAKVDGGPYGGQVLVLKRK